MIIQNIVFPSVNDCTEESLFFTYTGHIKYSYAEDCIYMKENASINFGTFYNGFSAEKWFEYTELDDLYLHLKIRGKVKISVFMKYVYNDEIIERCIFEKKHDSEEHGELFDAYIDPYRVAGVYCLVMTTLGVDAEFYGGYFYTKKTSAFEKTKLAILMHSVKHSNQVYRTSKTILEASKDNTNIIFAIIDSQHTIREKEYNFPGILLFNSGGIDECKRQLNQSLSASSITNVLLLDEDATIIPETIFRIYNFVSLQKRQYKNLILMGTILDYEHQSRSLLTDEDESQIDYSDFTLALKNENRKNESFNSWWFAEVPLEEYLSRSFLNNRSADESVKKCQKWIYINSACAWHQYDKQPSTINHLFECKINNVEDASDNSFIKLQNIILPSVENCIEEVLYFRRFGNIEYSFADDNIIVHRDGMLNFDTYFNGFSASKWFKYTRISNVKIRLYFYGEMRISLFTKEKKVQGIVEKCIKEVYVNSNTDGGVFDAEFNTKNANCMYCFNILGISQKSTFIGGFYYTENVTQNKIGLSIGICTYKREKYVYKNVHTLEEVFLLNKYSELKDNLFVYISDNAKTLSAEQFRSDRVNVFKNKNVGGAGGFTRTMIEAKKNQQTNGLTHILLMDDDVIIQPESIYRTYKILTILKDEYKDAFIGGAMLRTDLQWFQTESGGIWDGGKLVSHKQGLDLRSLDACLYNEVEETYEFNAWWYCTIPLSLITDKNLPMPIFIRGDDVEFGLRNMKYLILMNGICVWHEPFENKYSSSMFYYIFRNRLIDNSVRDIDYSKEEFLKEFKEQYFREVFTLRYKNAELLLRGVRDYLKGPEWLMKQDGEVLNQEIMSASYKFQNVNDLNLAFDYPEYEKTLSFIESYGHRRKRKLLVNGLFMKPYRLVNVSVHDAHIAWFYRAYGAVNYDIHSGKAFETYFDREKEIYLIKEFFKFKKQLNKEFYVAKRQYFEQKKALIAIDFWVKYLSIENCFERSYVK